MTFRYKEWRIQSSTPYGYLIQRRVGRQWKHPSYFNQLDAAISYLFEMVLNRQLSNMTVSVPSADADEATLRRYSAIVSTAKLEIIKAFHER